MGRDPDCDVYLDDPRVSREHAALRVVDGTWVLEDLSSRNGTWLDGERVYRLEITGSLTIRLASADDGPLIHLEVPTPPSGTAAPPGGWTVETPTIMGPVPMGGRDDEPGAYGPAAPDPPPPWPPPGNPWGAPAEYQGIQATPSPPGTDSPWGPGGEHQGTGASPLRRPRPAGSPSRQGRPPSRDTPRRRRRSPRGTCAASARQASASARRSACWQASCSTRAAAGSRSSRSPCRRAGPTCCSCCTRPALRCSARSARRSTCPRRATPSRSCSNCAPPCPGRARLSITAWIGGTYLGELAVELTAARFRLRRAGHHDLGAPVDVTPVAGAVSLVVRHDPVHNAYRFEFRDEDNPAEVTASLAYPPGPVVERMLNGLEMLARGRAGYSAAETRDYLVNAGAGLWHELIPPQLREQFWERRDRIGQLTILADGNTVPWELLYPFDRGRDAGFLVEQFPVTRAAFGRRLPRSLRLSPAWFVLPDGSPAQAREEVTALLRLFGLPYAPEPVIGGLTPLLDHIKAGDFGLLHFACHNAFDPAGGSAISLDQRQFTPTQLTTAAVGQVLAAAAPTVFINACRSAGASASYQQLDGWASKFLDAGAAAFIGSLWAVRDTTAREFAAELYGQLQTGTTLGNAVMRARQVAAAEPGDPTWLAYAVYGDPRAALR